MTILRTDSAHSGITIDYADGSGFVHGGSGPLTVYSDDEKAAINAMTDANDDTYYLFLVKNVTKLDANGNRTIVSGYMPVGYQHGFIFEQFDVARTIAHELSHGAFALHHTFSANTESFRADEGTTNNLMDYTEHGIALNHKQWRWMHENHGKGLFGFLADESDGESLLNQDAILSYLKLIHDANAKNQKQLAIPKTNVYFEGEDIQLGDVGKLTFIRIGDITNGKKEEQPLILFYGYNNIFIKPNEISETEIMKDDVKYTKYTFHLAEGVKIPTTEPELTETVALEIMVKTEEKQTLIDYINHFGITTDQLHNIYPNASTETIKAVTEAINKYCNEFEINTLERMAHFLGQIGVETGGKLEKGVESCNYSADRIRDIFARRIKGSVIENSTKGISLKALTNPDLYSGLSMEESKYYFSVKQIVNEKKKLIWVVDNTDTIYEKDGNTFIEHADLSINSYYTNGANNCALFNYVYCCNKSGLGNNSYETGDGSFFRGRGFIQLTGRNNYTKIFYEPWKRSHPDDTRGIEELVDLISDDMEISVFVSMNFWKKNLINSKIGFWEEWDKCKKMRKTIVKRLKNAGCEKSILNHYTPNSELNEMMINMW